MFLVPYQMEKKVSSVSTFRIKDIPKPSGFFRGKSGSFTLPKSSLERGSVSAVLEDFDFDLPLKQSHFAFEHQDSQVLLLQERNLIVRFFQCLRELKVDSLLLFLILM